MNYNLEQPAPHIFKKCTCCEHTWTTREDFLSDPTIVIIGYQVRFDNPDLGFLLFNHLVRDCETTMAIEAGDFTDLYDGPIYEEPLTNTDKCPEYCLNKTNLKSCLAKCACAYVREVIQIIKNWTKR
jgi:hypothetical protein